MTTLDKTLPELERQLRDAINSERAARKRADALTKIIEGVRELNGHASSIALPLFEPEPQYPVDENAPRGREAVRRVIEDRPGVWTLVELVEALRGRGWLKNRKATEVAVHRLLAAGEARRVGHGVYEFPAPTASQEDEPC